MIEEGVARIATEMLIAASPGSFLMGGAIGFALAKLFPGRRRRRIRL